MNYLIWFCLLIVLSAWMPRLHELHEKRSRMTAIAILLAFFALIAACLTYGLRTAFDLLDEEERDCE